MKKLPAETVYYIRSAAWELNSGLIFTSIWVLYYSVMKLSLVEVSVIYIVITVSNLVLEIPTGVLADVYSRRLSIILGGAFIGLAYTLIGAFPLFGVALLAAFVEAIGDTCVSGALQAWITDEVGPERVAGVFLRGRQVSVPAHWAGVLLSIALAALWTYQTPILVGGLMWFAVTAFLIVFMPETNFHGNPAAAAGRRSLLASLKVSFATFGEGVRLVRASAILQALFFAALLTGAFADSFYKFSRAYILQGFALPVITLPLLGTLKDNLWFGLLEMLEGLFCLGGAEFLRRRVQLSRGEDSARALLVFYALIAAALVVFVLTGSFGLALAAWVVLNGLRDLAQPVTEAWLNQNIPSPFRATVISMSSQAGMAGTLTLSTGLGALGDRFGVRSALGLAGAILLPVLVIYARNAKVAPEMEGA